MKISSINNSLNFGALKLNSGVVEQFCTDKNKNPLGYMADIGTLTTLQEMAAKNDLFNVKVAKTERSGDEDDPYKTLSVTIEDAITKEGERPTIRAHMTIGKYEAEKDWVAGIYDSIKRADELRAQKEGTPVTDWKALEAEMVEAKTKALKLDTVA